MPKPMFFPLLRVAMLSLLLASCATGRAPGGSGQLPAFSRDSGIDKAWEVNVDQRAQASPRAFSAPVVVHAPGGDLIVIAGHDARVHVYDASGSEVRRIPIDAPSDSGMVALDDRHVVTGDMDGTMYCIDVVAGAISWKQPLSSLMMADPVLIDGDIIVATGDNRIYRFSPKGEKRWSYAGIPGGLGMYMAPSPLVDGNTIVALFNNGDVADIKADTGDLLWRQQLMLDDNAVVLSELKVPLAAAVDVPAYGGGAGAYLVSLYQGDSYFLSKQDGSRQQHRQISLKSTPVVAGNVVYAADSHGALQALDAASGSTLWKTQLTPGELVGPVLWNQALWVADDRGSVYRVDEQGHVLGHLRLKGHFDRAPVAESHGVILRNDLGSLYFLH
ncbi:MAG TPA: PQQ-binding-like beta-propeller repeat protein [Mariprofundaceae bacterium]|nr:PQQ-binding-like beta-propeller repeat protein [Mariprofundaceae bacterium]